MIQKIALLFLLALCLLPRSVQAEEFITRAKQAIMVDFETGDVLFQKNAQKQMPTSSMSKVMTAYMVLDALDKGEIKLDDTFTVSEKAWKKGGSKMFVEVGKNVSIEDLLRGVIIQSGNDATIVLAEGMSGSEKTFAAEMTEKAQELGMNNSNFVNASGWPDPLHYSTAEDLALLGTHLIENFPDHYHYYAEKEFTYNDITQRNRNPLLYRNLGADGIKTGHTEAGGYGLMGSGEYRGRRVIFVINGLPSERARAEEGAKILEYGLRSFENRVVFERGAKVSSLEVAFGKSDRVALALQDDLQLTLPRGEKGDIDFEIKAQTPIKAPILQGDEIGTLVISVNNQGTKSYPVYALESVDKKGFIGRAIENIGYLLKSAKEDALNDTL